MSRQPLGYRRFTAISPLPELPNFLIFGYTMHPPVIQHHDRCRGYLCRRLLPPVVDCDQHCKHACHEKEDTNAIISSLHHKHQYNNLHLYYDQCHYKSDQVPVQGLVSSSPMATSKTVKIPRQLVRSPISMEVVTQ